MHCSRISKLKELCNTLWKNFADEEEWIRKRVYDTFGEKEHILHRIDKSKIVFDFDPIPLYNSNKKLIAIQIRDISHKDKLLIGCGNNPTPLAYQNPLTNKDVIPAYKDFGKYDPEWTKLIIEQSIDEINCHKHEDYVTIDPSPEMNPDIIGFFGMNKFDFLPTGKYKTIEFEGIYLGACPYTRSELLRLQK